MKDSFDCKDILGGRALFQDAREPHQASKLVPIAQNQRRAGLKGGTRRRWQRRDRIATRLKP
jgi:hypothetical protein